MHTPRDDSNVEYYDELAGQYRLFFGDFEASQEEEGRWLDRELQARGVRTVLDASAGTGRQAIPLRKRGYDVLAADPSTAMLSEAAREARNHGVQLETVRCGFDELKKHVSPGFDAVVAMGNGLTHSGTREAVVAAVVALRDCCRPGGTVLVGIKDFDTLSRDRPRVHARGVVDTVTGRRLLLEVWNYVDPVLECTAILLDEGSDGVSWHGSGATTREYMLRLQELEAIAREAGFVSVARLDHPREVVFALEVPDERHDDCR
jgi:SAM-dependent methyltransferase